MFCSFQASILQIGSFSAPDAYLFAWALLNVSLGNGVYEPTAKNAHGFTVYWWIGGSETLQRAGIWVIERQSKPSNLSQTLSRALNITVTTVIAGQGNPIRTKP